MAGQRFRADINGLRAVAVILVLIYHLNESWLPGGFLGVDIFLVISGFLISKNILSQINKGTFSFNDFYTRRLKRLLPALGITIALTLICAYLILPSFFLKKAAESGLFALASLSNIYFWMEAGYFDLGSELKPLLHTWSLGLEEQFYLLWPVILFLIYKLGRKALTIGLVLLTICSLGFAEAFNDSAASAAFFLLPFRIFEFGLGAICVFYQPIKRNSYFNTGLLLIGLLLILVSAIFLNKHVAMPGLHSLWPCLGAVAILLSDEASIGKILLANPIFQLIGKASYSIYLVHWPVIVLWKQHIAEASIEHYCIMLLASIVLGVIIWKFVEVPFRYNTWSKLKVWTIIPSFLVLVGFGAWWIKSYHGAGQAEKNPYLLSMDEWQAHVDRYAPYREEKDHIIQGKNEEIHLVMGDSHAIDLFEALHSNGYKYTMVYLPANYCSNFGGVASQLKFTTICERNKNRNLKSTAWQKASRIYLHDDWSRDDTLNLKSMLKEIRELTEAEIYVFGPRMTFKKFPDVMIKEANSILPDEINRYAQGLTNVQRRAQNEKLLSFFGQKYFSDQEIFYVDVLDLIPNSPLVSMQTGALLYWDSGHFTKAGCQLLGERLRDRQGALFK